MAEKIEVQILATDKASKDLRKLSKNLKGVERQAKKTDKPLARLKKNLSGLKSQILPATAIVAGFGFALKKAFDLAEQGAVVQQTRESFELLMDQVGAAPNILDQLRSAARGTVDDLTLMSSTQTLLAGATTETAADATYGGCHDHYATGRRIHGASRVTNEEPRVIGAP